MRVSFMPFGRVALGDRSPKATNGGLLGRTAHLQCMALSDSDQNGTTHAAERNSVSNSFQSWLREHRFALRRLHSLSGIVPIGLFLINHLLANSTAFLDEPHFNHHVGLIHSLPWLLAVEIVFIFIPLAFHAALGVTIAWEGKANQFQYPYMNNWRYTLQRVTAWITVVFVMVHLLHFRFAHWLGGAEYKAANPAFYWVTQEGFLDVLLPAWLQAASGRMASRASGLRRIVGLQAWMVAAVSPLPPSGHVKAALGHYCPTSASVSRSRCSSRTSCCSSRARVTTS